MKQLMSLLPLLVAVLVSFIGCYLFELIKRKREALIRSKLKDLAFEEKYLDKLKKGNIALIRESFKTIFLSLSSVFCGMAAFILTLTVNFPEVITFQIRALSLAMLLGPAVICFSHFRSLTSLDDLEKSKSKIREKREKLAAKLIK